MKVCYLINGYVTQTCNSDVRALKSWYTGRDPEQGFWRFFSDELNWSLVSSVTRTVHELNI